ncbi:hypothetical protein BSLG_005932 [Batrachochytrium salamandrivorans]|nr:hypothetical protein BSLG_005932 [Batrachochytrium salamandrivorans]
MLMDNTVTPEATADTVAATGSTSCSSPDAVHVPSAVSRSITITSPLTSPNAAAATTNSSDYSRCYSTQVLIAFYQCKRQFIQQMEDNRNLRESVRAAKPQNPATTFKIYLNSWKSRLLLLESWTTRRSSHEAGKASVSLFVPVTEVARDDWVNTCLRCNGRSSRSPGFAELVVCNSTCSENGNTAASAIAR